MSSVQIRAIRLDEHNYYTWARFMTGLLLEKGLYHMVTTGPPAFPPPVAVCVCTWYMSLPRPGADV